MLKFENNILQQFYFFEIHSARYPRSELERGENPVTCRKLRYLLHNFQIEILFHPPPTLATKA